MVMNKIGLIALVAAMSLSGCGITNPGGGGSGSHGQNAGHTPKTYIESLNDYALDVDPTGITYTIDISTPEGAAKLNKISLAQAEDLALTEAVIKNNCAMLVNPQFTNLTKDGRVLRITVFGFPARYRARPDRQYDSNTHQQIDVNINK